MLEQYRGFFAAVESSPLNPAQARAVVNGERSLLVLAGAGSGKTSVLVARAGWLLTRGEAAAEQILLWHLVDKPRRRWMSASASARVLKRSLRALFIPWLCILFSRAVKSSDDQQAGERQRRAAKTLSSELAAAVPGEKAQAKGWRLWLEEEMDWQIPEGDFWQDKTLQRRIASRLDRWVSLMRMHGGSQAEMIAGAPEEVRDLFGKRVKLMAPLLKAWKTALKDENAVDFSGLIHQAINVLDKGRFVSPWKHILVDEFQDISPQRASLLAALRRQNTQTTLFAVGDDWQAIYRFSGAQLSLTTAFNHYFGEGDCCALDTTYRFNSRIGEVANGFIQQNPHQLTKPLNSLVAGDKKAVTLLAQDKLDDLLDKMSGYVKREQRILLLARYHHLKPAALEKAATRWPHLHLDFMTIHASKGNRQITSLFLAFRRGMTRFPHRRASRLWSRRCYHSRRIFPMPKRGVYCMSPSPAHVCAYGYCLIKNNLRRLLKC